MRRPDVPEPVSANLRPAKCVTLGTELSIDIYGFTPNEQVGFWLNAPNGAVGGTVQTSSIGPEGAIANIPFATNDLYNGIWSLVFQGTASGHQSIIYFKIEGGAEAPAAQPTDLPPAQNAVASPTSGPRGTIFSFQGGGFTPGEALGVYVTAPDQSVFGAPFQVKADDNGVSEVVQLRSSPDFPVGVYAITFEGIESGAKAIAYFRIVE
jgi:hypothetical protein